MEPHDVTERGSVEPHDVTKGGPVEPHDLTSVEDQKNLMLLQWRISGTS